MRTVTLRRVPAFFAGGIAVASVVGADPQGWYPFGPAKWYAVAISAVLATWATLAAASPTEQPQHRLPRLVRVLWATLIGILTMAAVAGREPVYAWIGTPERRLGMISWLIFAVCCWLGARVADIASQRVVARVVTVAALANGIYCLVELIWGPPLAVTTVGQRIGGTYGSSAFLAAALCLLIPVSTAVAADRDEAVGWRVCAVVATGAGVVALIGSGTRAGFVGLIVGLTVLTAARLATTRSSPNGGSTGRDPADGATSVDAGMGKGEPSGDTTGPPESDDNVPASPDRTAGNMTDGNIFDGNIAEGVPREGAGNEGDDDNAAGNEGAGANPVGEVSAGDDGARSGTPAPAARDDGRRRRTILVTVMAAAALLAAILLASSAPGESAQRRVAHNLERVADVGASSRLDEWRVGGRIVAAHPVLGVGPEGYRTVLADGITAEYERSYGRDVLPDRAHNSLIDVAAAGGLLAGGVYLLLVAVAMMAAWRRLRSGQMVTAGFSIAVVAYAAQQFFLFPVATIDPVFWLFVGIVTANSTTTNNAVTHNTTTTSTTTTSTTTTSTTTASTTTAEVNIGPDSIADAGTAIDTTAIKTPAKNNTANNNTTSSSSDQRDSAVRLAQPTDPHDHSPRPITRRVVDVGAVLILLTVVAAAVLGVSADRLARRAEATHNLALAERATALRPDVVRYWVLLDQTGPMTITGIGDGLAALDKARAVSPHDPVVAQRAAERRLDLAIATGEVDDVDDAVEAWRALADDPNCYRCQLGYGYALALANDLEASRDAFERASQLAPVGDAEAADNAQSITDTLERPGG